MICDVLGKGAGTIIMTDQVWTDADYDTMSWHDAAVHGLRFIEGEHGTGEFVLDIDYILEWIPVGQVFQVRVQPATLTFRGVFGLKLSLDYASCSAGFTPFSIHGIERRSEQRTGYIAQMWNIPINFPRGEIMFEAKDFEQRSRGQSRLTYAAALTPEERGDGK
jgi:hypothetical protein